MTTTPLLALATSPATRPALSVAGRSLTYGELLDAALTTAGLIGPARVVAVHATPTVATCVAVVAAMTAGVAAVPINPGSGPHELAHILDDSQPDLLLSDPDADLPPALAALPRVSVEFGATRRPVVPREPSGDAPALIVYTSGTTGPPKGVVLSRQALAAGLDGLAEAWQWTATDVVTHALPLFHVHGLVLGVLGPLRLGGGVAHPGRFTPEAMGAELAAGATMMFGVPTMYHRLADAMERDPTLARQVASARLLVSGSAALPAHDRMRITAATGQPVLERYGMTETLITCAMRVSGGVPGTVGTPIAGVELQLVDDEGATIAPHDGQSVGEILVRGTTLFDGYLNRPDATAESFTSDGWFRTGDLATWAQDGSVRISGRRSVDLIKSGGFKIGAGEIENILLGHGSVAEVAVTGEPDSDLGEMVVAWVVRVPGREPDPQELIDHVGAHLASHKRPREIRFLDALPRNEMGKIRKGDLASCHRLITAHESSTDPPPGGVERHRAE